jgi:hypothetical protein
MINLQKLSLVTLSAVILSSVGGHAPAAAAQLFFNISGSFSYEKFESDTTSIYDELDRGSFTGFFSLDSEEDDTNPAVGDATYELSSWQIDLLTQSGDLVGQLTSTDGGGSGEILVDLISRSPSSFRLLRTYRIEFQDVLTGGTNAGVSVNLQLVKIGFSCSTLFFDEYEPLDSCKRFYFDDYFSELINSIDKTLPDLLPQEIIGSTSPFSVGIGKEGNQVIFANQSPTAGRFYVTATVSAGKPASVPEPGTGAGLGLVALGWLLKKKVAFSQKTKAIVKARKTTSI